MPLELIVEDINTVPEPFRGEYAEKDGKFHLAVNGLTNLYAPREALTKANREAAERRHALTAWETAVGGRSVEDVQTLIADIDSGKFAKGGKSKEEFDAILAQHKTASEKTLKAAQDERDTAYNVARKALVDGELKSALAAAKATKTGLAMLPKLLGDRIELTFENGEAVRKILAPDGKTPMVGNGPDGYATLDDLMKDVVKSFPDLFEGSGAGGGGGPVKPGGGSGGGVKTWTRAEFDAASPKDRAARMNEGYQIAG
ncbi:hypothetical protein ACQR1I_36300 [Bradyrhizobium sp. HKCCYLS2038]|uniref:hypothetical protein n=1 Tax=Bradyrhizobium sp. HKCCYLS2038 TaxID=3420764 RepID=UPI003EB8C4C9